NRRSAVVATIAMAGLVAVAVMAQEGPDRPTTRTQLGLPHGVAEIVRAFVPDEFEITDFQAAEIYSGKDPFTERVIRSVLVPAQARDGSEWLLVFGIDKARSYMDSYHATPREADSLEFLRKRDFELSRDEVEAIAREFAVSRFPGSFGRLTLVSVSEPLPPAAGGFPLFSFRWEGRVSDRVRTGDQLYVWVSPNTGTVLMYEARAALDFDLDAVAISRDHAIGLVSRLVEEASIDPGEVRFSATLILSHPRIKDEGPAWVVAASRPGTAPGNIRMLRRVVDARTGEMLRPLGGSIFEAAFFKREDGRLD
ncbi:MAG: hypothetical protein ACOX9R_06710, partial [Armatimonadota bacterium]